MQSYDPTDFLTNSLTSLQLQSSHSNARAEETPSFTLFPTLPTELRLKILSRALPVHTTLHVNAHLRVADPSFGLYITFAIASAAERSHESFSSPMKRSGAFRSTRALELLLVNKEARTFYLENFPCSLPSGRKGEGRIRFSRLETVCIENFELLMDDRAFAVALKDGYRLQDWWNIMERLAVPLSCFVERGGREVELPPILREFTALKELKARLWEGFEEEVTDEEGRRVVRLGMESHLTRLREKLREQPCPRLSLM